MKQTPAARAKDFDIVISVYGGCVTHVFTDIPGAKVVLIDWDNLAELSDQDRVGGTVAGWPFPLREMPSDIQRAHARS
jgi:hypothetical protein